jgi:hypothetical protein
LFTAALAACGDDGKLPLGASCETPEECASGACVGNRCVAPVSDEGAGLCTGIRQCIDRCSGSSEDVQGCSQACFQAASNDIELMLADSISICSFEGCGAPVSTDGNESWRAYYECQRTSCLSELSRCHSGNAYGADPNCANFSSCMSGCGGEALCERGCGNAATESAVRAWFDLDRCILGQCSGLTGTEFDACATSARGPDGACGAAYMTCFAGGGEDG